MKLDTVEVETFANLAMVLMLILAVSASIRFMIFP